jgi:hypothetical protein
MNTNKSFVYGIFAVLIALAFIACPEPDPTHTHTYSTAWSHNATQHWHECTANDGAKTDVANHTGDPCAVCEYTASVNQPPTAKAGTDQTLTLAENLTITLNGTGSAGNITAYAWQCETYTSNQGAVSAEYTPAQVNALIANANTATATVAPRKAGTYVFKLTVTDTDGGSDTDTVTVVVEAGTVTKDVNVTFPAFATNPTVIDLNPIYNGITSGDLGNGFNTSDIRFEIKDNMENTTVNFPNGTIDRNRALELYPLRDDFWPWGPMPLFNQTFYGNGGNTLGEYSFFVGDRFSVGYFVQIYEDTNGDGIFQSTTDQAITSLPPPIASPLILQLSRTVTELP